MRSANFEILLLASPLKANLPQLRDKLRPLRRLHHELLDCVEAHYSDTRDALVMRLMFSRVVRDPDQQGRLAQRMTDLGLDVLVPGELAESRRASFESALRENYGVVVQQYPSASSESVFSTILDALEVHTSPRATRRRLTTELATPSSVPEPPEGVSARAQTVDALDAIISELPCRPGTIEALDAVISELPRQSQTVDAMDAALAEPAIGEDEASVGQLPYSPGALEVLHAIISELPRSATVGASDSLVPDL